jgi:exonuclease III
MASTFRLVTWNCRRASSTSKLWDYLLELDPDVALLQDYGVVPNHVLQRYTHAINPGFVARNRSPRHMTGVLVKGTEVEDLPMPAPVDWVARELDTLREFFTAKSVTIDGGITLKVLSVYSPAFPIDRSRLNQIDTRGIQLTQSRDLWATELMWATVKTIQIASEEPFVVAGDLNSSETFDYLWRGGPRGNREIMDRMNALGFYDCLRMFKGKLTPTFRTPRGGVMVHQLAHLYVTPILLSRLAWCDIGSAERVFDTRPMLSDHLPIVAEFTWPA